LTFYNFYELQTKNYLDEEDKTFKFKKRHVSATPVPSSVCGWNNNDEHLQDSPGCWALCSSECFVVIDQATTRTQLKIKEAVHVHWEKPSLNQQLFHVNLTLSM